MAFVKNPTFYDDTIMGSQRPRLSVEDAMSGTGNAEITLTDNARELVLLNDAATDLTFMVVGPEGSFTFTLKGYETIDERFPDFHTIHITASGAWRGYVRSSQIV
jgi:hypothetical protein